MVCFLWLLVAAKAAGGGNNRGECRMNLTEFGSAVRKARIDARVTLKEMAEELGVTPAFLSGLEVGRKKVPVDWVRKIENFFKKRRIEIPPLQPLASMANESVPLKGLSPAQQALVAGFARHRLTEGQVKKFATLLAEESKGK
jgi:transcriptional regulator with XRE-family HTH domain